MNVGIEVPSHDLSWKCLQIVLNKTDDTTLDGGEQFIDIYIKSLQQRVAYSLCSYYRLLLGNEHSPINME